MKTRRYYPIWTRLKVLLLSLLFAGYWLWIGLLGTQYYFVLAYVLALLLLTVFLRSVSRFPIYYEWDQEELRVRMLQCTVRLDLNVYHMSPLEGEGEGRRIASSQRRTKKDKKRVYIVDSGLPVLCLSRRLPSGGHEYIFVSVGRDRGAPWRNSKLMQSSSATRA
nr:hypothetical protein [uncultured Porphyromonas sp.]